MRLLTSTLAGAILAAGCASSSAPDSTPEQNAGGSAPAPVAARHVAPVDVDLSTIKVAPGEVVAVPRPSRLRPPAPEDGPVYPVDLAPRAERDQPQMPAWHSPTPARCNIVAADHHACPSGYDRRLSCASTENLSASCKVVGNGPDENLAVCCATSKESK